MVLLLYAVKMGAFGIKAFMTRECIACCLSYRVQSVIHHTQNIIIGVYFIYVFTYLCIPFKINQSLDRSECQISLNFKLVTTDWIVTSSFITGNSALN